MNCRARLPQPAGIAQELAFGKYSPLARGELYVFHAVLLGGKVASRFAEQKERYVPAGEAMARLVRLTADWVLPHRQCQAGALPKCEPPR
jgi:hypothetical protein